MSGRLARLAWEAAPPMRHSARRLLEALARKADDGTGELRWPVGTAQLEQETGYARSQLRRARRELEALGLVRTQLGLGSERTRYALDLVLLLGDGAGQETDHPGEGRALHPGEALMPPVNPTDAPGESTDPGWGLHEPTPGSSGTHRVGSSGTHPGFFMNPPTREGARARARARPALRGTKYPPLPPQAGGDPCRHGRTTATGGCRACGTTPRAQAAADRAASVAAAREARRAAQLAERAERERIAAAAAAVAPAGAAAARAALAAHHARAEAAGGP